MRTNSEGPNRSLCRDKYVVRSHDRAHLTVRYLRLCGENLRTLNYGGGNQQIEEESLSLEELMSNIKENGSNGQ
jgi:hypothetical protein